MMAFELGYPASWDRLIKLFVAFKVQIYVWYLRLRSKLISLLEAKLTRLALSNTSRTLAKC
jgi:hypothetical protein